MDSTIRGERRYIYKGDNNQKRVMEKQEITRVLLHVLTFLLGFLWGMYYSDRITEEAREKTKRTSLTTIRDLLLLLSLESLIPI